MRPTMVLKKVFPWCYYNFYPSFFSLIFFFWHISVENVCFLNQCLNGGTCMEVMGSHSCLCMEGFSGSVCESELLFHLVVCTKTSCTSRVHCVLDHYLYFSFIICFVFVSFCSWCFVCLLTGYKWYPQSKVSEKW